MKYVKDDSGPKQRISFGIGSPTHTIDATPRQVFMLLQQAWNMRECVRLLTPGVSEQQFTIEDQRWIAEANDALDKMFRTVGLKLIRARELFAPDNCPDLIVPHVVFETEPVKPTKPTAPVHQERDDIFDDYGGQDQPVTRKNLNGKWVVCGTYNNRGISFAYCPRCGGVDTIRNEEGMKIKPILWPHIFRENQMANDMGCSCGE